MNRPVLYKRITAILQCFTLLGIVLLAACSQEPADKAKPASAPASGAAVPAAGQTAAPQGFTLTLLHTNDTHSTYGGFTDKGLVCYAAQCEGGRGGYVRLDQAIRAVRQTSPDAVLLDAGDIFQGTLFWTLHRERMPAVLLDRLGYQALIPGNHEFDDGCAPYFRYLASLKTPVTAANLSFEPFPALPGPEKIRPYVLLERGGRKIGVVGIVNPETPELASPCPETRFREARETLQKTAADLAAQGADIIIALTHLGFETDKRLAREVDGVDIIVGGHSHSLLSNADPKAEGPYPSLEKTPDGSPILVVSASTACAYLGRLDVRFDDKGIAKEWSGAPILLDQATLTALNAPAPDAELAGLVDAFAAPVTQMMQTSIGRINAAGLDGKPLEEPNVQQCRRGECLTGNIVADALRLVPFKKAQVAIINGGALRNSLPGGSVTPGDVLGTLPFQNTPVLTDMPGSVLLQALEHSVATFGEGQGRFLQVSGLRYAFDPAKESGSRVAKAEVLDENGRWQPLEPGVAYAVVTVDFTARGGDGYTMFTPLEWTEGDKLMNDALRVYLEQHSPVEASLQDRIIILR